MLTLREERPESELERVTTNNESDIRNDSQDPVDAIEQSTFVLVEQTVKHMIKEYSTIEEQEMSIESRDSI